MLQGRKLSTIIPQTASRLGWNANTAVCGNECQPPSLLLCVFNAQAQHRWQSRSRRTALHCAPCVRHIGLLPAIMVAMQFEPLRVTSSSIFKDAFRSILA